MTSEVARLLRVRLTDADTGWSMGTPGAVAEFMRGSEEAVSTGPHEVISSRGGIRVKVDADCRLVAYETPAGPHGHWNHTVAVCVPTPSARPVRSVITDLGPDDDALRAEDRDAVLFDLGLGLAAVDVCVRTADRALVALLRKACGKSLFADASVVGAVVASGPHRVFATPVGRVEVYAPIPPADGRSPDGPHTHLLPNLLRSGRTHPATAPIPDGYLPVAALYPPHPAVDRTGGPRPWDRSAFDAFAELLDRFGDPEQRRLKERTWAAVRAGTALPTPTDAPGRAAVAVALRQLARLEPPYADAVAALRGHATDDLLDPEGDQHGG